MTSPTNVACLWHVWVGTYTEPARVIAPLDATLDEIGRTGHLAVHKRAQDSYANPDFADISVSSVEVTRIERVNDVALHPRVMAEPR